MPYTKISFQTPINYSLQIGDAVYVSQFSAGHLSTTQTGLGYGLSGLTTNQEYAGEVVDVDHDNGYIIIYKDPTASPIISMGDFILFSKNTNANKTSLKGYYADITMENSSTVKTELFAVSSDISLSSK